MSEPIVAPSQAWLELIVAVDALIELEPFDAGEFMIGFRCDEVAQARRRLPVSSAQPKRRQKRKRERLIEAVEAMLEATLEHDCDKPGFGGSLFDARRRLVVALRDFK